MRIHSTYKHENNTDVAILVLKRPFYIPEKREYKVKVEWINIVNPNNVFKMRLTETIRIKEVDMRKWKEFTL